MNLSSSGMASLFKQDVVTRQLSRSASAGGKIFDPTSSAQKSNHETDKQAEENATWFFEYKALLNSKLTTLTTSLTSAYTTDLDASMARSRVSAANTGWGDGKNAMQGITGSSTGPAQTSLIDPGAVRTAVSYLDRFGGTANVVGGNWNGTSTTGSSQTDQLSIAYGGGTFTGTTTFFTGTATVLDSLRINFKDNLQNDFDNNKIAGQIIDSYPDNIAPGKMIGNNMELTLYKFFSIPENYDLLRFGMLDNLYVVGTSSLATGSQVQGSLAIRFDPETTKIKISQERFSCFFHS